MSLAVMALGCKHAGLLSTQRIISWEAVLQCLKPGRHGGGSLDKALSRTVNFGLDMSLCARVQIHDVVCKQPVTSMTSLRYCSIHSSEGVCEYSQAAVMRNAA